MFVTKKKYVALLSEFELANKERMRLVDILREVTGNLEEANKKLGKYIEQMKNIEALSKAVSDIQSLGSCTIQIIRVSESDMFMWSPKDR